MMEAALSQPEDRKLFGLAVVDTEAAIPTESTPNTTAL